jgi:hypothetical protein
MRDDQDAWVQRYTSQVKQFSASDLRTAVIQSQEEITQVESRQPDLKKAADDAKQGLDRASADSKPQAALSHMQAMAAYESCVWRKTQLEKQLEILYEELLDRKVRESAPGVPGSDPTSP